MPCNTFALNNLASGYKSIQEGCPVFNDNVSYEIAYRLSMERLPLTLWISNTAQQTWCHDVSLSWLVY